MGILALKHIMVTMNKQGLGGRLVLVNKMVVTGNLAVINKLAHTQHHLHNIPCCRWCCPNVANYH